MVYYSILLKYCGCMVAASNALYGLLFFAASLFADYKYARSLNKNEGPYNRLSVFWLWIFGASTVWAFVAASCFEDIAVRWKTGIPLFAMAVKKLLLLVRLPVSHVDGSLHYTSMIGPLEFPITADHLGVVCLLIVMGVSLVYLCESAESLANLLKRLCLLAAVLSAVAVLRMTICINLFIYLCNYVGYETQELPIGYFYNSDLIAFSYIPFLVLAKPLVDKLRIYSADPSRSQITVKGKLKLLISLMALVLVLFAFCKWEFAGVEKSGKVLIDNYHTRWSPTTYEYNKEWFGSDSGYNYNCLKRYLSLFYPVAELKERITEATLEDVSVLILYIPDKEFSEDERKAIASYVKKGGGLFVIGEHTNVFGSASHLNQIVEAFGFRYRDDILFDQKEDFFQIVTPGNNTSQFLHGVEIFRFKGPCSIQPFACNVKSIVNIGGCKAHRAIYSVNNFYPPPYDLPKMRCGTYSVAVASHFGQGRVYGFSDSTVFSNFEIFYPGKYEFILNALHWLNHKDNKYIGNVKKLALILMMCAVGFMIYVVKSPRQLFLCLTALVILTYADAFSVKFMQQRTMSFPAVINKGRLLYIVADPVDESYGLQHFYAKGEYENKYEIFSQWVLRNNMFSAFYLNSKGHKNRLYNSLVSDVNVEMAICFILKNEEDVKKIRKLQHTVFQDNDRFLFIIDDSVDADRLLHALSDMRILEESTLKDASSVDGVEKTYIFRRNDKLCILVLNGRRFSDRDMGYSEKVIANDLQRKLYDQEYKLLDTLFQNK